ASSWAYASASPCWNTAQKSPRARPRKSSEIQKSSRPISARRRRMLEIKNLRVTYDSITALHALSLKAERGSIVTLIGANGAGKTTTLRAISGIVKSRGGEILFENEPITN